MEEAAHSGRQKYTYGGVVFIYDRSRNREVTSYRSSDVSLVTSGTQAAEPIMLDKQVQYEHAHVLQWHSDKCREMKSKPQNWTSHSGMNSRTIEFDSYMTPKYKHTLSCRHTHPCTHTRRNTHSSADRVCRTHVFSFARARACTRSLLCVCVGGGICVSRALFLSLAHARARALTLFRSLFSLSLSCSCSRSRSCSCSRSCALSISLSLSLNHHFPLLVAVS